jgi:hypothetical protein
MEVRLSANHPQVTYITYGLSLTSVQSKARGGEEAGKPLAKDRRKAFYSRLISLYFECAAILACAADSAAVEHLGSLQMRVALIPPRHWIIDRSREKAS